MQGVNIDDMSASPSATPDAITRLHRACNPIEELQAEDPRYVDCDEARGEHLVREFARTLRRCAPEQPAIRYIAGHRGVGKTSELNRLKHALENPPAEAEAAPMKVVMFDVSRTLDLNDLDFPDLLVFLAGQIIEQLGSDRLPGFTPVNTYLERVWGNLKRVLTSEVELTGAEVDTGFVTLATEIKNRPDARTKLRQEIEKQSTVLIKAVNDVLETARVAVAEAGLSGLVVLIDGLDKVELRTVRDGRTDTHERLFIERGAQMSSINALMVLTVPISLVYSPRFTQQEQAVGARSVSVPMIRLHDFGTNQVDRQGLGMRTMMQILEKRCQHAEVGMDAAFDYVSTAEYLCEMSGGHPRHLLSFVQSACSELDALPITRAAAEEAIIKAARGVEQKLDEKQWAALARFDAPRRDLEKDELHKELLFLLHIFEYANHELWYEVNPILRVLRPFQRAVGGAEQQ